MHPQYLPLLQSILSWAQHEPGIQGVVVIGSQARSELVSDRWSDLDLMVFTADPQRWMKDNTWFGCLNANRRVVCHFNEIVPLHFTNWSWRVKRVLYDDALDVDFSILPFAQLDEVLQVNQDIISKGHQIIYDSSPGLLESKITALLQTAGQSPLPALTSQELQNIVSELLYHIVWACKKIKRRELWIATYCINVHMRGLLLRLIEAHNASIGRQPDFLRYTGRFLEQRAAPQILSQLPGCFTKYDEADAIQTLQHLFDITCSISREICDHEHYPFDAEQFAQIQEMFTAMQAVG